MRGRLRREGSPTPSGVPWIDRPGEDDVLVRFSRAIGLAGRLPDIHGLAIRVLPDAAGGDEGPADLLLASTGEGRIGRFLLTFARNPGARPLTTLVPYRTSEGAVLIGARRLGDGDYVLSWARPAGDWQRLGVLRPGHEPYDDREISFDPVQHPIPGLDQYAAVTRLREPSYARARASRS